MPPPYLAKPEWFLKNIVNRSIMKRLGEKISFLYDQLLYEIVYRAHHDSFKVRYADIFYEDFMDVASACGLKKNFYKYLSEQSTLRYMIDQRKKFVKYLKKRQLFGDIRWSFEFFLSQLSFWYVTNKSFYNVWRKVVYENYKIPHVVDWDEGITLYLIDFVDCFDEHGEKCIKKRWIKKYEKYVQLEREDKL